jgi:hypothetical protein
MHSVTIKKIHCSCSFQNYLCWGNQASRGCDVRGRGINFTIIVAVTGNHVPQVLILPTVLLKNHRLNGASTASVGVANSTVGQMRGSVWIVWRILSHVKGLVRKIQLSWFWTIMSSTCQSQPSMWEKKMAFSCLSCRPIHHISYSHCTALSSVQTKHITMLALCCQSKDKL